MDQHPTWSSDGVVGEIGSRVEGIGEGMGPVETGASVGATTGTVGSWGVGVGTGGRVGVDVGTTPFASGQPHVTMKPLPSPTVSVPSLLLSPKVGKGGKGGGVGLLMRCVNPCQSRDPISLVFYWAGLASRRIINLLILCYYIGSTFRVAS